MANRPKATPRIGGEGAALELERPLAAELSPGRPLAAHFHAPEGMVLLREPPGLTGFFAGSLGVLSMEDVFAHVLSGIRSGQLVVQHGVTQRAVSFRDGQVTFATSSERHERLGAIVVKLGLISPAQLSRALARVTPSMRLGRVLTREGMLSDANLYNSMTYLVREVVLSLFEMDAGSFLFLEGRAPEGDSVKLPERTKDLVLQGIKRGEAVARLRRRFPDDTRVVGPPEAASPGEEALFEQAAGGVTLGELRPVFEGSQFAFLTWVEERVRDGALVIQVPAVEPAPAPLEVPAPVPVPEVPAPVPVMSFPPVATLGPEERYNTLLAQVYQALRLAGENPSLLRGFLDAPPPGLEAAYEGVRLGPDGRLEVERLRRNVASTDGALSRVLVLEALDAFVSYALFAAKNVLPPELAERLTRRYRDLQEGLS